MKKLTLILAIAALTPATAAIAIDTPVMAQTVAVAPTVGKMLYSTGGKKLAAVYKLAPNGAPQILLDGRLVTVPAATLSEVDGKTQTSLSMKDLMSSH